MLIVKRYVFCNVAKKVEKSWKNDLKFQCFRLILLKSQGARVKILTAVPERLRNEKPPETSGL